jgi:spermidine/putrescine transport system ATP-binding protein
MGAHRGGVMLAATEPQAGAGPAAGAGERPPAAVHVSEVVKSFGGEPAVRGASLVVEPGEFISILGPSGCGKTTLLRIIAGFERQDSGSVHVSGQCVDKLPPDKRDVNTVFQRYALFPHMTVAENIAFPLELDRVPKADRADRVAEMVALVHLEGLEKRNVTKLSGGQAQRVALARALAARPSVLLLDEPLTALDLKLRKELQLELRRVQEELRTTFVFVTHDQEEALTMSDRIVVMNDGRIVQEGTPEDIYGRPASVFVSRFIGEANLLDGVVAASSPGSTRVAVGEAEVAASGCQAKAGDQVVVSVRPECIRIDADERAEAQHNGFPGEIRRVVFLGSALRCHVEIAGGTVLTVQTAATAASMVSAGDRVTVSWHPEDSVVLPADQA